MQDFVQQILSRLEELENWKKQKELQQVSYPLDPVSKIVITDSLNPIVSTGTGSATTQSINLTGNAQTITVPAQPTGTVKVVINSVTYELLYK